LGRALAAITSLHLLKLPPILPAMTVVRYGTMVEEETYWDTVRETRNLLGEEVKRRILLGSFALSAGF